MTEDKRKSLEAEREARRRDIAEAEARIDANLEKIGQNSIERTEKERVRVQKERIEREQKEEENRRGQEQKDKEQAQKKRISDYQESQKKEAERLKALSERSATYTTPPAPEPVVVAQKPKIERKRKPIEINLKSGKSRVSQRTISGIANKPLRAEKAEEYQKLSEAQGKRWTDLSGRNREVELPIVEETPVTQNVEIKPMEPKPEVETVPTAQTEKAELKEIEKEIKPLSEKEKVSVLGFLAGVGFRTEKLKNNVLASITGHFARTNLNQDKYTTRLMKELTNSFKRDAKNADKRADDIAKGKGNWKTNLMSPAMLAGNVYKLARTLTDITGRTATLPYRYMTMLGMSISTLSEAGKEAHLRTDKVAEKTRIKDAEGATEEAWNIYLELQKVNGEVSAEQLEKDYVSKLPQDLLRRLQTPAAASNFIQKFVRWDIGNAVKKLDNGLKKIEQNQKYTPEQKEKKRTELLNGIQWKNALRDYDRMITEFGTVDEIATSAIYLKAVGRGLVGGAIASNIEVSLGKIWQNISHHGGVASGSGMHVLGKPKLAPIDSTRAVNPRVSIIPHNDTTEIFQKPEMHPIQTPSAVPPIETNIPETEIPIGNKEGDLVHALEKLALKHDLPNKLPGTGIVLDAANEGRTLNEAENMVRLLQGHNIGGVVSAKEFADAVKFENGSLHIINQAKFDEYLEKLHAHSSAIDTSGAQKFAGNVNWEEKVHGAGHTEVTGDQIEKIAPFHETGVEEARNKVLENMNGGPDHIKLAETSMGHMPESVKDIASTKTLSPEDLLGNHSTPAPEHTAESVMAHATTRTPMRIENPATYQPYNIQSAIASQRFNEQNLGGGFGAFPGDIIRQQIDQISQSNLHNIFTTDAGEQEWIELSSSPAKNFLGLTLDKLHSEDGSTERFVDYLNKLKDVSGLTPKNGNWFRLAETNSEYITRALQKVAELGQLDKVKL